MGFKCHCTAYIHNGKNVLFLSRDGGESWSCPRVINYDALDDRDVGLCYLGGKKLFATWFSHPHEFYESEKMQNWIKDAHPSVQKVAIDMIEGWDMLPEERVACYGAFCRVSEDGGEIWSEPRRTPVSSPHGPVKLKNGKIFYFGKRILEESSILKNGSISAYESDDDGRSWRYISSVSFPECCTEQNIHEPYAIELEDGTVLVAYRATGYIAADESLYCTRIIVSQSKDGGKTWKFHSLMCDYRNEIASGVWEPHFGTIDGVLTCFYANDSHTVLEPPYQHIEYLQWINGEWTNRTIVANGVKHESRDGMPVWQQLSNGKYVCIIEGWVPDGVTLSVQILWSDDGVKWSEPVIIYRAKNGSCGAPYVLELPTGQLLVTFQTNENFEGDTPHSEPIMYMMLSDGTPVEYLTAENFSRPENAFNIEPGEYGLWNCAYLSDKYLYIGTDTNDGDNKGVCIKRIALEELYKQLEE